MSKTTTPPTFALLIGINDYSALDRSLGRALGSSDLQGAVNDLRSMAMLTRMMDVPAANIRVLSAPRVDPNTFASVAIGRSPAMNMNMADAATHFATRAEMLAGLRWLAEQLTSNPGAQGIIYYSGHSVVTEQGHLCFVPQDAYRGPPPTADDGALTADHVVSAYLLRGLVASALAALLGGEHRVAAAWSVLAAHRGMSVKERVEAAVSAAGLPVVAAEVDRFRATVGAMLCDPALPPGDAQTAITLDAVEAWGGLTAEIVASTLHGDPFAEGSELRNLISFNRAFVGIFRDVPQSCAVTAVLETCLKAPAGGKMHPHYVSAGIPFAVGGQVLLGSCRLGQPSNLAVFDNHWHGAFTWAMVSVLSQRTVLVSRQGRSFDLSNGALCARIGRLLEQLGFDDQVPALWSQDAQARWPVFGRPGWRRLGEIPPVRVKEEIDAGSGGHVFELKVVGGSAHVGWLVCTTYAFDANDLSWAAGKDYWIWDGVETVMPPVSFRLVPALQGKVDDPIEELVDANDVPRPAEKTRVYSSASFQGSGTSDVTLSGFYRVKKGTQVLGTVVKSSNQLSWRRCQSGPTKLVFTDAANRKMASGEEILFEWVEGQDTVSVVGDALVESPD